MFAAVREWIVPSATAGALVKRRKIRPKIQKPPRFRGTGRKKGRASTLETKMPARKMIFRASRAIADEKIAAAISDRDLQSVKTSIAEIVSDAQSKITLSSPFSSADGLSYLERIQVIESLERPHKLKIPDRNWQQM